MASVALTAFNARVDASTLGAAAKTTAKTWGDLLYRAAAKEAIVHLRFHASAVLADATATAPEKTRAQAILDLTAAIIAKAEDDTWWLEAAGAV